jgi:hypothetical protein
MFNMLGPSATTSLLALAAAVVLAHINRYQLHTHRGLRIFSVHDNTGGSDLVYE